MRLKIAFVLLVTAACLVWVLWGIDPEAVAVSLAGAEWAWMIPVMVIYVGNHGLRSLRLKLLLGQPVPFWSLVSITAVGFLAINVVPARLGEFVRPYMLLEKERVPFGTSMAAILLERLLDISMLLGMLLLLTFAVELPPGGVVVGGIDVVVAGQRFAGTVLVGGCLGVVGLLLMGPPVIDRVEAIDGLPKLFTVGLRFLRFFHGGLRDLLGRPVTATVTFLMSIGMWSMTILAVWCAMHIFDGIPLTWQVALTAWTITLAGMTVAPTPGFFGAYEAFCLAALLIWGVDADVGRTFAVVLHLGQFGFTVLVGGGFLLVEGLSLRSLVRESRAVAAG